MDTGEDSGCSRPHPPPVSRSSLDRSASSASTSTWPTRRTRTRRWARRSRRSRSSSPTAASAPTASATSTPSSSRDAVRLGRPALAQNSYSLLDRDADGACSRSPQTTASVPGSAPRGRLADGQSTAAMHLPDGSRMTLRPDPYLHLQDEARLRRARRARRGRARPRREHGRRRARLARGRPPCTQIVVGPRRPTTWSPSARPAYRALRRRAGRARPGVRPVSVLVLNAQEVEELLDMEAASRRWPRRWPHSREANSIYPCGRSSGRRTARAARADADAPRRRAEALRAEDGGRVPG